MSTSGSDKVGFTVIEGPSDSQPEFIGGVRGAIERNTMRYEAQRVPATTDGPVAAGTPAGAAAQSKVATAGT